MFSRLSSIFPELEPGSPLWVMLLIHLMVADHSVYLLSRNVHAPVVVKFPLVIPYLLQMVTILPMASQVQVLWMLTTVAGASVHNVEEFHGVLIAELLIDLLPRLKHEICTLIVLEMLGIVFSHRISVPVFEETMDYIMTRNSDKAFSLPETQAFIKMIRAAQNSVGPYVYLDCTNEDPESRLLSYVHSDENPLMWPSKISPAASMMNLSDPAEAYSFFTLASFDKKQRGLDCELYSVEMSSGVKLSAKLIWEGMDSILEEFEIEDDNNDYFVFSHLVCSVRTHEGMETAAKISFPALANSWISIGVAHSIEKMQLRCFKNGEEAHKTRLLFPVCMEEDQVKDFHLMTDCIGQYSTVTWWSDSLRESDMQIMHSLALTGYRHTINLDTVCDRMPIGANAKNKLFAEPASVFQHEWMELPKQTHLWLFMAPTCTQRNQWKDSKSEAVFSVGSLSNVKQTAHFADILENPLHFGKLMDVTAQILVSGASISNTPEYTGDVLAESIGNIKEFLKDSRYHEVMVTSHVFGLLNSSLVRLPKNSLLPVVVEAITDLRHYCMAHEGLYSRYLQNLLLDFRLWINAPVHVQVSVLNFVDELCTEDPTLLRAQFGLHRMLTMLRMCFWYEPESVSVIPTSDVRPTKEELHGLRNQVLQIVFDFIQISFDEEDINEFLKFLQDCEDERQVEDILELLFNHLDMEQQTFLMHTIWDLQVFSIFLTLLNAKRIRLRVMVLRVIWRILCVPPPHIRDEQVEMFRNAVVKMAAKSLGMRKVSRKIIVLAHTMMFVEYDDLDLWEDYVPGEVNTNNVESPWAFSFYLYLLCQSSPVIMRYGLRLLLDVVEVNPVAFQRSLSEISGWQMRLYDLLLRLDNKETLIIESAMSDSPRPNQDYDLSVARELIASIWAGLHVSFLWTANMHDIMDESIVMLKLFATMHDLIVRHMYFLLFTRFHVALLIISRTRSKDIKADKRVITCLMAVLLELEKLLFDEYSDANPDDKYTRIRRTQPFMALLEQEPRGNLPSLYGSGRASQRMTARRSIATRGKSGVAGEGQLNSPRAAVVSSSNGLSSPRNRGKMASVSTSMSSGSSSSGTSPANANGNSGSGLNARRARNAGRNALKITMEDLHQLQNLQQAPEQALTKLFDLIKNPEAEWPLVYTMFDILENVDLFEITDSSRVFTQNIASAFPEGMSRFVTKLAVHAFKDATEISQLSTARRLLLRALRVYCQHIEHDLAGSLQQDSAPIRSSTMGAKSAIKALNNLTAKKAATQSSDVQSTFHGFPEELEKLPRDASIGLAGESGASIIFRPAICFAIKFLAEVGSGTSQELSPEHRELVFATINDILVEYSPLLACVGVMYLPPRDLSTLPDFIEVWLSQVPGKFGDAARTFNHHEKKLRTDLENKERIAIKRILDDYSEQSVMLRNTQSIIKEAILPSASSTELIGRAAEQEIIVEQLRKLCESSIGSCVIISGDQGIGKSAVVDSMIVASEQMHVEAMVTTCNVISQTMFMKPWKPILEAVLLIPDVPLAAKEVQDHVMGYVHSLGSLIQYDLSELTELVPLFNMVMPELEFEESKLVARMDQEERIESLMSLIQVTLRASSIWTPKLIVIEDVEYMDDYGWELLRHLQMRLHTVMFAVTTSVDINNPPANPEPHVEMTVEYLNELRNTAVFMHLNNLKPADTLKMIVRHLGCKEVEEEILVHVTRSAQGNPLKTVIISTYMREAGVIRTDSEGRLLMTKEEIDEQAILDSAMQIVSSVHGLPERQLWILKTASVHGGDLELPMVSEIMPLDQVNDLPLSISDLTQEKRLEIISTDIAALEELKMVVIDRSKYRADTFKVVSDLVRQVCVNDTTPQFRRITHRDICVWVETTKKNLEPYLQFLAHNWEKAGYLDKSVQYYEQVGEFDMEQNDLVGAIKAFEKTITMFPVDESKSMESDPDWQIRRCHWHRRLCEARYATGDVSMSMMLLDKALKLLDKGLPKMNQKSVSGYIGLLGQLPDGVSRIKVGKRKGLLGRGSTAETELVMSDQLKAIIMETAYLHLKAAELFFQTNMIMESVACAVSAVNIGEVLEGNSRNDLCGRGYSIVAAVCAFIPDRKSVTQYYEKMFSFTRSLQTNDGDTWINTVSCVKFVLDYEWQKGIQLCNSAVTGDVTNIRYGEAAMMTSGYLYMLEGKYNQADAKFLQLLESCVDRSDEQASTWGLVGRANALFFLGEYANCRKLVDSALEFLVVPEEHSGTIARSQLLKLKNVNSGSGPRSFGRMVQERQGSGSGMSGMSASSSSSSSSSSTSMSSSSSSSMSSMSSSTMNQSASSSSVGKWRDITMSMMEKKHTELSNSHGQSMRTRTGTQTNAMDSKGASFRGPMSMRQSSAIFNNSALSSDHLFVNWMEVRSGEAFPVSGLAKEDQVQKLNAFALKAMLLLQKPNPEAATLKEAVTWLNRAYHAVHGKETKMQFFAFFGLCNMIQGYIQLWKVIKEGDMKLDLEDLEKKSRDSIKILTNFFDIFEFAEPRKQLYSGLKNVIENSNSKAKKKWTKARERAEKLELPQEMALLDLYLGSTPEVISDKKQRIKYLQNARRFYNQVNAKEPLQLIKQLLKQLDADLEMTSQMEADFAF